MSAEAGEFPEHELEERSRLVMAHYRPGAGHRVVASVDPGGPPPFAADAAAASTAEGVTA